MSPTPTHPPTHSNPRSNPPTPTQPLIRPLQCSQVYSINNLADLEIGIEEVTGTDSASSGAGLTRLEQRTIAREIKKVELIGEYV